MASRSRRPLLVLLAVLSVGALGAGIAWACTPQAGLSPPSPSAGEPGADVTLTGRGFPADEPVRIRWNGEEGPLLATVNADAQQAFTVTVRVPADAQPGQAVFLAVPQEPRYTARAAFTVSSPQSQAPPPAQQPSGSQAPAAQPQPQSAPTTPATAPSNPASRPRQPARSPRRARGERPQVRRETAPARRTPAVAVPQPTAQTAPPAPVVQPATRAADSTAATRPAQSRSRSRAGSTRNDAGRGRRAATPSQASAGSDLWSGFSSGSPRPSLGDAATATTTPSPALTVGMALFGLGLLTMVGGAGTVALRRRRLLAEDDRRAP